MKIKPSIAINNLDRIIAAANSIPPRSLNLKNLINEIGITSNILKEELKKYNKTPKDIIDDVKIKFILNNFNKKNIDITLIAYECGFYNLSNFNRFFLNKLHMSPKEYLLEHK